MGELVKVYDSLDTMKDLMAHFTRSSQNDVQDVGHALEKLTENTTKFDKVLPGKVNNFCYPTFFFNRNIKNFYVRKIVYIF